MALSVVYDILVVLSHERRTAVAQTALTVAQVAERLALSPNTVRRLLKSGALPGRQFGRQWRIDEETLTAYLRGKDPVATP